MFPVGVTQEELKSRMNTDTIGFDCSRIARRSYGDVSDDDDLPSDGGTSESGTMLFTKATI